MERGRSRRRKKAKRGFGGILAIFLIAAVILAAVFYFRKTAFISEGLQTETGAAESAVTETAAPEAAAAENVTTVEKTAGEETALPGNGVVITDLVNEDEWNYTDDGKKASHYSLRLPRIEISENHPAADQINKYYEGILEEQNKSKEEFMEIVQADEIQEMLKQQETPIYLEESEGYDVLFNQGRLLTISLSFYGFRAGAHGYGAEFLNSFDTSTGEEITLKALAKEEGTFRSFLAAEITKSLEEQGALEGIFEGSLTEESIANYCLVPEGLRILYNPYDIACYAAGAQEIIIPYEGCIPYLNEYGKELISVFTGQGE